MLKRTISVALIVLLAALILTLPASAAGWQYMVTGHGDFGNNSGIEPDLRYSISVSENDAGMVKGHISIREYESGHRYTLEAECLRYWSSPDIGTIVSAGSIVKRSTDPEVPVGSHMIWSVLIFPDGATVLHGDFIDDVANCKTYIVWYFFWGLQSGDVRIRVDD